MNRKRTDDIKPEGAPGWMVTYGDMMSLLLVFFILIFSFSTVEIIKFKAAMGYFKGAIMPWTPQPTGREIITPTKISQIEKYRYDAIEEIQKLIEEANLANNIEVYDVKDGIKMIFDDPVLFEEGKAELKEMIFPILRNIIKVAGTLPAREIKIEGHTDDTPINTERFPSNWELSVARALQVLKFFQREGYPPENLVAVGYGEFRPRKALPPDASVEEKGVNRRVEIFLSIGDKIIIGEQLKSGYYQKDNSWGD